MSEPDWQKAAPDDWEGEYIDVAIDEAAGIVRLRESSNPGIVVTTTTEKWNAFVLGVKAGEFDHFVDEVGYGGGQGYRKQGYRKEAEERE